MELRSNRAENSLQRRLRLKNLRRIVLSLGLVVAVVCAFGIVKHRQEVKEVAWQAEQQRIREEALAEEERLKIETNLENHVYGEELRALYEIYPQMKKMLLNLEDYPENIVEFFITHTEAVDWVVNYPEYMAKSEEELEAAAEEAIREDEPSQNGIPLLYQWDERWGYVKYNVGLIATEGCGPTCLSMIAIGLTGDRTITPKVIADISLENGYYVAEGGSTWSLMYEGASKLGIVGRQVPAWSPEAVKAELAAGKPMIFSLGPGDFTEGGHFIVVSGLNEDGTVMVNDPNSRKNSEKSWEIQTILDQTKGMWSFTIS